jgi:GNAT superfamily N-acetyltransferase
VVTSPLEETTRRWVAGWAHSRGVSVGTVEGWPIAHVRSASRAWEIVCAEPDPEAWGTLLDDIVGDRTAMLTLVAADPAPYLAQVRAPVRVDRDDESLMWRDLRNPQGMQDIDLHTLGIERTPEPDGRLVLRLLTDEQVAAEGHVAVLGDDAVFDRIETTPRFRRQGLARWLMAELTAYAVEQGATTGLLCASAEGAELYGALGWDHVAPVRSLMGS